jgi:prepilin-type N-terminal cleavage/methylation domain-containing protein
MLNKQQSATRDRLGNNGFTLIEVLVATAIFAIGILALTSLQAVYIGGNSSARMQTEATTLAAQWLERLKILPYAVKTIRITVTPANLRGRPVNLDFRRAEDWR